MGKVKEILSLKEYGKNPTAQVVGVANMDAYMNRIEEERAKNIEKIKYRIEKKIDDILDGHKDLDNLFKQLKEFESERRNKQYELSISMSEMWTQRNHYHVNEGIRWRRTYVSGMWRRNETRN